MYFYCSDPTVRLLGTEELMMHTTGSWIGPGLRSATHTEWPSGLCWTQIPQTQNNHCNRQLQAASTWYWLPVWLSFNITVHLEVLMGKPQKSREQYLLYSSMFQIFLQAQKKSWDIQVTRSTLKQLYLLRGVCICRNILQNYAFRILEIL